MDRFQFDSCQLARSRLVLPALVVAGMLLLAGCANRGYSTAQVESQPEGSRVQSAEAIDWSNRVAQAIAAKYGKNPLYRPNPSGEGVIVAPLDSNHMLGRFAVKTSSGWPELDAAYVAAANAAGPFPPCPDVTRTTVAEHFQYQPES